MNLEQQVCTLEQAKRLKKLGVKNESIFKRIKNGRKFELLSVEELNRWYPNPWVSVENYNAYTSAELGEMICKEIENQCLKISDSLFFQSFQDNKIQFAWSPGNLKQYEDAKYPEAHARAEFLIYLLENRDDNK